MTVRMIDSGAGQLYFPPKVTAVCPFSWNVKQRPNFYLSASDLVASVQHNTLRLALYHPASMALYSPECGLYAAVLLIFLYVLGGFSCLLPNAWQGDVAFALGNIEIPQSLTLGAFVAIHNTSEWWTGSSALPGRILFSSKCVFCWLLVAFLFSRGLFHQGRMPQGSKGNYCDSGAEVRLGYPGRPIMFSSSGECFSLRT